MKALKIFYWFMRKNRFFKNYYSAFPLDKHDTSTRIKKFFFPDLPVAATMEEWDKFHEKWAKEKPLAYWFSFELPIHFSRLKRILWETPRSFLHYRIFDKYHTVDTKLKPGYYDIDTRMLHSCFSLLVDYVELEKAYAQLATDSRYEKDPTLKDFLISPIKSFKSKYSNKPKFPNRELGLKYLKWEMTLDDPSLQNYSPEQAVVAKEAYELYIWWKDIRPTRESSWSLHDIDSGYNSVLSQITHEKDEEHDEEDLQMLIRLMKIRKSLWT